MFDQIAGELKHAPRHCTAPIIVSVTAHTVVAGVVFAATVFLASERLPEIPTMMAFVAAPPVPLPPPMPASPGVRARPEPSRPAAAPNVTAPIEAPLEIASEADDPWVDEEGVPDLVEGGVPGGMAGGVVGGLEPEILPPPPPAPPAPRGPVRVGGEIREPALLHRVEPVYPPVAVVAGLEGTVILEAVVDRNGIVESLRVLRSQGLLDKPALEAVRQWRYSPVLLNGQPERFILTVVVSFRLQDG